MGWKDSCVTIMHQLRARMYSENCTFGLCCCVNIKLSYMKMSLGDMVLWDHGFIYLARSEMFSQSHYNDKNIPLVPGCPTVLLLLGGFQELQKEPSLC